jgi:hypothetical protein
MLYGAWHGPFYKALASRLKKSCRGHKKQMPIRCVWETLKIYQCCGTCPGMPVSSPHAGGVTVHRMFAGTLWQ